MDLIAYKPAVIIAGVSDTFANMSIDGAKVLRIYEEPLLSGGAFRSYDPTRSGNSLNGFTQGRGYLVYPKANFSITTENNGWDGIVTLS